MNWTTGTSSTTANDTAGFGGGFYYYRVNVPAPKKPVGLCPHRILGVACQATPDAIRTAYRQLARQNHPDLGLPEEAAQRTAKMQEINRAYDLLRRKEPR